MPVLRRWPVAVGIAAFVDQHRVPGDIAAEQQALRAAQNFHRLQVQHVHHDAVVDAQINAVDENAYGWVDGRDRARHAKAANRKVGDALAGSDTVKGDIGERVTQIFEVGNPPRR